MKNFVMKKMVEHILEYLKNNRTYKIENEMKFIIKKYMEI